MRILLDEFVVRVRDDVYRFVTVLELVYWLVRVVVLVLNEVLLAVL